MVDLHKPAADGADLAGNLPGQGARDRAAKVWAESLRVQPVRTMVARLTGRRTQERALRISARGEEIVGAVLERLGGRGWKVIHSVPVGWNQADIDHIVIGPGGVFTVNSKHHPKAVVTGTGATVTVDGEEVPYLQKAALEADQAERRLSDALGYHVEVTGIIALVHARSVTVKGQLRGAIMKDVRYLRRWFRGLRPYLSQGQIEEIYGAARRASLWTS
ncbi:MAG: NERD domain-containing protein [Nocardioides sp.]|nr:NERD domain-containing protein [Nocardioides sp.]